MPQIKPLTSFFRHKNPYKRLITGSILWCFHLQTVYDTCAMIPLRSILNYKRCCLQRLNCFRAKKIVKQNYVYNIYIYIYIYIYYIIVDNCRKFY